MKVHSLSDKAKCVSDSTWLMLGAKTDWTLAKDKKLRPQYLQLTQQEAAALIPILQRFVETGSIEEQVK